MQKKFEIVFRNTTDGFTQSVVITTSGTEVTKHDSSSVVASDVNVRVPGIIVEVREMLAEAPAAASVDDATGTSEAAPAAKEQVELNEGGEDSTVDQSHGRRSKR